MNPKVLRREVLTDYYKIIHIQNLTTVWVHGNNSVSVQGILPENREIVYSKTTIVITSLHSY